MRTRYLVLAVASLAIGVAYPYAELAFKCRQPDSEACVWAKSFWSLSIWVEPPIIGVAAFVALALATTTIRAFRRP